MKFSIDFNRENHRDKDLLLLGAKLEYYEEYTQYELEISNLEELEELDKKVKELIGVDYALVLDFDPPSIYLDKEV